MYRLKKRGFDYRQRLFTALNRSDGRGSAVKDLFSGSVVERCLVEKWRNIRSKLSGKFWGGLVGLFMRLGYAAPKELLESWKNASKARMHKPLLTGRFVR